MGDVWRYAMNKWKRFFSHEVVAVIMGFVVASVVIIIFKIINYILFVPPMPSELDAKDLQAAIAWTQTFPPIVWYMVLLGWAVSSLVAGYAVPRLIAMRGAISKEYCFYPPLALGMIILTFALVDNIIILPGLQPLWVSAIGWVCSLVLPLAGGQLARLHLKI